MDRSSTSKGVLLKGLPFRASKASIQQFFRNIDIPDQNITMILFRDMKPSGLAYVKMTSGEVQRALLSDRNHMGDRYVEVMPSNDVELYDLVYMAREGTVDARELNRLAGRGAKKGVARDRSPIREQVATKCAYITGIPPGYTYRTVREFFKGCLIAHNCIYLLKKEGSGAFRGDGYIEFGSKEECLKGLRKDGGMLGNSIINIVPCSNDEMTSVVEAVNGRKDPTKDLRVTIRSKQAFREKSRRRTPSPVRKRMKAYAATYGGTDEHHQYPMAAMEGPMLPPHMHHPDFNKPTPHEFKEHWHSDDHHRREETFHEPLRKDPSQIYPPQQLERAPHHDHGYGGHPAHEHISSRHGQEPRGHYSAEKYPPHYDASPHHGAPHEKYHPMDDMGPVPHHQPPFSGNFHNQSPPKSLERRIVRLEGLPYEANVRDIIDFFQGYYVEYEHVRLQCREDGSPSGKAFVTFPSEKHARAAVHNRDKQYVLGRYVEVVLV